MLHTILPPPHNTLQCILLEFCPVTKFFVLEKKVKYVPDLKIKVWFCRPNMIKGDEAQLFSYSSNTFVRKIMMRNAPLWLGSKNTMFFIIFLRKFSRFVIKSKRPLNCHQAKFCQNATCSPRGHTQRAKRRRTDWLAFPLLLHYMLWHSEGFVHLNRNFDLKLHNK